MSCWEYIIEGKNEKITQNDVRTAVFIEITLTKLLYLEN
jgi:hypothetical protein